MSAVLVGHTKCWACGRRCEVKQIQTRGNRMYLACVKDCSTCMRVDGAEAQARLWRETEFLSGVPVKRPSNVTDDEPETVGETLPAVRDEKPEPEPDEPEQEPEEAGDWSPDDEPDEPEPEPETRGGGRGLLALLVLGAAGVAGALMG